MKFLSVFLLSMLLVFASCSSDQKNELKKSFAEKVASKVKDASVHSLGCKTGDSVYADVKGEIEKRLSVDSGSSHKSVLLVQLCEQGVEMTFPHLVDLGDGKLPESWQADGCKLESVGEDVKELAVKLCKKLE